MGFFTRLIAGLVAASTLGAGLAGTAGAVDTTGATGDAKGVVKLASDDTSGLPDHLVNGDFSVNYHDQWKDSFGGWTSIDPNAGKTLHATSLPSGSSWKWTAINGWDKSKFGWTSTQKAGSNVQQKANAVELQYDDSTADNVYAELCAYEAGTAIYQDIRTVPGTLYKVRLKHASLNSTYLDKMQVMIGTPGHEQPVEMTRTTVNGHGDKLNEKSTTIATKVTNGNNRHHADQWETYEGTYLIPDGQTTTRFTFKSIDAKQLDYGNVLDDIVFDKAYRLNYDKNASDASGQVPSNERGRENTVQPAKAKTNGTVKTVADENVRYVSLANGDFSYPSFSDIQKNEQEGYADLRTFLKSDDGTLWYNMSATDLSKYGKIGQIPGFDSSRFAWSSTENGSRVELQQDRNTKNTYAEIVAQQDNTSIYQNVSTGNGGVLYKIRLKHASRQSSHADRMQVLVGSDTDHATPVEMTRVTSNGHGDKVGGKSTTITTKVSNTDPRDHGAQWETYEGYYQVPEGQKNTVFMFKSLEGFKEDETLPGNNIGNLVDDIEFSRSYKLTYDKNASDATGKVPSNQRGKENAVEPAESKTTGNVKTVADNTSNLPDHLVNGTFDYRGNEIINENQRVYGSHDTTYLAIISAKTGIIGNPLHSKLNNWDSGKFGWKSNDDTAGVDTVEVQRRNHTPYPTNAGNVWGEIAAAKRGKYIYQDIATTPGVMYKWSLKHASRNADQDDSMQVMIGEPGKTVAQQATRTTSNGSDKTGSVGTTITTHGTAQDGRWETYTGDYLATSTTTRFTFRSVRDSNGQGLDFTAEGNCVDDLSFDKAYKLSYDKNSSDATGSVPSNQYGKENTVKPAEAKTTGTVKTVADDDSSKSLTVNPGFDVPDYSKLNDGGLHWMYVSPAEGKAWSYYDYINPAQPRHQVAGLSQATFGWQELTGGDYKTTSFELHREKDGNVCADVHGSRTIGQTIDTQAGVAYTVSIRHSGRSKGNAGSVQVLVGPDKDHLRPLEMSRMNVSRTGAKYGDSIGSVGTVITTHSDSVDSTEGDHPAWDHSDDWETYSGTYVATGGKTVFAYRGVDKNGNAASGNDSVVDSVIDDLSFKLAYRLTYDKNAQDTTGGVPSSQYGKENTVEPTKAKTTGRVGLAADKTASGLTVHDLKNGEIAPVQYGDFKFSTIDGVTADQITDVNGFTVKTNWNPTVENQAYAGRILGTMYQPNKNGASLVLHHVGQWRDSSGTQRWLNAKITVNGQNLGSLVYYESQHKFLASYGKWDRHTSSRPYMDVTVDFLLDDGSTPQGLRGVTGFTDLDGGTSGYNEGVELVSGFDGAYVRSDAHLARFGTNGWAGATDENENNADAHGMKHYVGATFTGSSFRVRWSVASGQARGSGFQPVDSTIAYRLTYDKNAQDATGSIPSDTSANTTQPAKSETDGKVSDLVQRTTTHEDGSVTVRTVDQSTDVVSGCQVYYPAGQRITLATLAKDGDCWDSSMLTRPGHTQLGWSQDSQATQAQAEVTMVEGGMTVYAVWVGNPVLTYDTNKPNTWNGQMPSTPASVSVAYNTAAADGSGWQSGDTSKIRGYRFLGWYAGPQDDAGPYDWNTLLTGNVTVYAHWQRLQSNVVYDANGGTGSHANTTGWQYSDVTVPSDTSKSFKRDGYVFLGWDTQADGNGTAYKDGSQVPLQDKDITLYAQWQPVFEQFTPTGGVSLPLLVAGGVTLLVMGIGSTVMLTRRMRGEQ